MYELESCQRSILLQAKLNVTKWMLVYEIFILILDMCSPDQKVGIYFSFLGVSMTKCWFSGVENATALLLWGDYKKS